jgi:hypothetical protein
VLFHLPFPETQREARDHVRNISPDGKSWGGGVGGGGGGKIDRQFRFINVKQNENTFSRRDGAGSGRKVMLRVLRP